MILIMLYESSSCALYLTQQGDVDLGIFIVNGHHMIQLQMDIMHI